MAAKERALTELRGKDERALWLADLDTADSALDAFGTRKAARYSTTTTTTTTAAKKTKAKTKVKTSSSSLVL